MDFISKFTGSKEEKPTSDAPKETTGEPKPSNSDLMGSAKVLADAAKEGKYNDPKAAGAAADLLGAAEKYGKLDENKGIGQYVDKAEDYLRQYGTSHSTPHEKSTTTPADEPPKKNESESGGGAGDYIKMAEGFFNKK